jgi:hypothetical protein
MAFLTVAMAIALQSVIRTAAADGCTPFCRKEGTACLHGGSGTFNVQCANCGGMEYACCNVPGESTNSIGNCVGNDGLDCTWYDIPDQMFEDWEWGCIPVQ